MRAIMVVGSSGSGKTTMARPLADRLGLVHIELDAIYHQPKWQPLESNEFVRRVDEVVREAGKDAGCGRSERLSLSRG